jgi:hypothetical protein
MERLNLGADVFSLRDYIGYLFPGVVSLFAIYIVDTSLLARLEGNKLVGATVLLLGGYVAGFLCNSVGWYLLFDVVGHKIIGDPFGNLLGNHKRLWAGAFDGEFKKQLVDCLAAYWGEDLVKNGSETNLMFLCWRVVQEKPNPACAYLIRLVSLYNMAASLVVACLLVLAASLYKHHGGMIVGSVVALVFFVRVFFRYRLVFAQNVYRMFFARYRDARPSEAID